MEEVRFIEYLPQHAYEMDWKDKDEFLGIVKGNPQFFHLMSTLDDTLTMVRGDKILALISASPTEAYKAGIIFFMSNTYVDEFDKEIFTATKVMLDNICKKYSKRVSLEAKATNIKLIKFLDKLGFKKEGVMRKKGHNGEDYILFSIVEGD